jgi:hypothetical protein
VETPAGYDKRGMLSPPKFPNDVLDPGFQRAERPLVSFVERFLGTFEDREERRAVDNQEVVAA